jgi:hypothetical protein
MNEKKFEDFSSEIKLLFLHFSLLQLQLLLMAIDKETK